MRRKAIPVIIPETYSTAPPIRPSVLPSPGLSTDAAGHLAARAALLDTTYRDTRRRGNWVMLNP